MINKLNKKSKESYLHQDSRMNKEKSEKKAQKEVYHREVKKVMFKGIVT